ncbi:MAG: NAD(P)-dependent oxidoreductase [Anaerolineae bacterium]
MNTLIVGATGATGRLLVEELINRGHLVKVIVRSAARLPDTVKNHPNLSVIEASLLDLTDAELTQHLQGIDAVASCLGHNLTFKGLYGHPRRLVTDATRRLCEAIRRNNPEKPVKFVLMNTTGNRNLDLNESISLAEKAVVGLLRLLLPPHSDNEQAAGYLSKVVGQHDQQVEWVAVRPDGLLDIDTVSEYEIHPSPIVSAIFGGGKTSRINVAHFKADLITSDSSWAQWKGQMPVIYNK